ncbi:DUF6744 family protein (plasmid) [Paenibacillus sp. EC2-1]|uniref:DUF6744 family protein n=1 Tax=Paenibacillus sp. EC2-1 TaxID=3388665 RepID=UPI003BEECB3F
MTSTVAVARSLADVKSEELLGFLEFHTVSELRIHKDELETLFVNNNMNTKKFLPGKIKPHDAYRRATKKAESTIDIDYLGEKKKARLLVREVRSDQNIVIRHLVREIVDSKNEQLAYNPVGKFILNRKSDTMDISWDASYLDEYPYDQHVKQIKTLFIEWTEYHTRDTINNIVRRIISAMNHVAIMPNGKATFIPKTQRFALDSLIGLFEDLKSFHLNNGESVIEIIPIIDTVEQREMVQKRIEAEISNDANELLADFSDLLGEASLTPRLVKSYATKVTDLQIKLEEYEDLIHRKMGTIQNQLSDALSKIKTTRV